MTFDVGEEGVGDVGIDPPGGSGYGRRPRSRAFLPRGLFGSLSTVK
jgi:hypothetical protein